MNATAAATYTLTVEPKGVTTPFPLSRGQTYQLTISGTWTFTTWLGRPREADAFFEAPLGADLTTFHERLSFNGRPLGRGRGLVPTVPPTYRVIVTGSGFPLRVELEGGREPAGGLTLEIEPQYHVTLAPSVEAFTPAPLPAGTRYRVTLTGTYRYNEGIFLYGPSADACYHVGAGPNYVHRYHGLHVDGVAVTDSPYEEDRHRHEYSFRGYTGTGRKLSLLLKPPAAGTTYGSIAVVVAPLSAAELEELAAHEALRQRDEGKQRALEAARFAEDQRRAREEASARTLREAEEWNRRALERKRQEVQRKREEREQLRAALAKKQASFERRYRVLEAVHEVSKHHLDPTYQQRFARKLMHQLLAGKETHLRSYLAFVMDSEFIEYLKERKADHLIEWRISIMRSLALAEQYWVEPAPAPELPAAMPQDPPRRRLTTDEWRDRALARKLVKVKDLSASLATRDQALVDLSARHDLDEDEQERLTTFLTDLFLGDFTKEDENNERATRL